MLERVKGFFLGEGGAAYVVANTRKEKRKRAQVVELCLRANSRRVRVRGGSARPESAKTALAQRPSARASIRRPIGSARERRTDEGKQNAQVRSRR
eukprot:5844243-Pleurochrysis_carterae.AAC.1